MDSIGDNLLSVWCENRNEVRYTIHNTVFVDSSSHIPSTADAGVDILAVYSAYTAYVQCTYSVRTLNHSPWRRVELHNYHAASNNYQ